MRTEGSRIFYLRDATGFPVMCVAASLIEKAEEYTGVQFATATYNFGDKNDPVLRKKFPFKAERYPQIALGRLEKNRGKIWCIRVKPGAVKRGIVEYIRDNTRRPQVKQATELWLARKQEPRDPETGKSLV